MQVEQIDFDAADEFFIVWYPETAWGYEPLAEAFASHRHQARAEVVREIVEWMNDLQEGRTSDNYPGYYARQIEAKFGGRE